MDTPENIADLEPGDEIPEELAELEGSNPNEVGTDEDNNDALRKTEDGE